MTGVSKNTVTKLLVDIGTATDFMQDLAGRLSNRIQLTTDGHKMYVEREFEGQPVIFVLRGRL